MPTKQLSLYDTIENRNLSRNMWREKTKTARSTYKVDFSMITILKDEQKNLNVREVFEGIEELADDIFANGLIDPLEGFLSENGKKFYLTDGERRYRAIQVLRERNIDFQEVEVFPVSSKLTPMDLIVRMLSSGIHKSMYKDVEVANGLLRLKTDFNLSNEDIGGKLGRSRQWVDNMIKLAKQPKDVQEKVSKGEVKKTQVVVPMKDKLTDVTSGLTKSLPQPGLPASLKTNNEKAERQDAAISAITSDKPMENFGMLIPNGPHVEVSGKDALQGVNFDKEVNEQEAAINRIAKAVNKIEGLSKGLNDQGQKDLDNYLKWIRTDIEALKTYYATFKNRAVK